MLAALASPSPAQAQKADACGPVDAAGAVTCDGSGNPYRRGITYSTPAAVPGADTSDPATPVLDLSVVLTGDVAQKLPASAGAIAGIGLTGVNAGAVSLAAQPGASVTTRGAGQVGIDVTSQAGAIAIDLAPAGNARSVSVSTEGDNATGVLARSDSGAIQVNAGKVTTQGTYARGIDAQSTGGGAVTVDAARISTASTYATGIRARSDGGDVTVSAGDVATHADSADAIGVRGNNADVTIRGSVSTNGFRSYGTYARAMDGSARVRVSGDVHTYGLGSHAIDAAGSDGVDVSGKGTIETSGYVSTAVVARAGTGDAVVDLASVAVGNGAGNGIVASSDAGGVSVKVRDVSTAGDNTTAVNAYGVTSTDVRVTGTASVGGAKATAVNAYSQGKARVRVADVTTTGDDSRAIVVNAQRASAIIDGTVAASGSNTSGARQAAVMVVAGDPFNMPYATGPAKHVSADVTVNGAIDVGGASTGGVQVYSAGRIAISGTGSVTTHGDQNAAVEAAGFGDIAVGLGSVTTDGLNATGVIVNRSFLDPQAAVTGNVSLDLGSVTTHGALSTAVLVHSAGDASATIGTVSTDGIGARGVFLGASGDTSATLGSVVTSGTQATGVQLQGNAVGATIGSIATSGYGATALVLRGTTVDATVTGAITTAGDHAIGITSMAAGDQTLHLGTVTTTGADADGITIDTGNDPAARISVTADALSVSGTRSSGLTGGITTGHNYGGATGTVSLDIGKVANSGLDSTGVSLGVYGDLTGHVGAVAVTGDGAGGIGIGSTGSIDVRVDSAQLVGNKSRLIQLTGTTAAALSVGDVKLDGTNLVGALVGTGFAETGVATLDVTGAITGRADNTTAGYGIYSLLTVTSAHANAIVDGSIAIDGAGETALELNGADSAVASGSGLVSTTGDFARGIMVSSAGTGQVNMANGTVATSGYHSRAVIVTAAAAGATVGTVSTKGTFSDGVVVTSGSDAAVTVGSVSTSGRSAYGMLVEANGAVSVEAGSVSTSGDGSRGIAIAAGGDTTVRAGTVTTSGASATGISSYGSGAATVAAGTVATTGARANGIQLTAGGPVQVTLGNGSVSGTGATVVAATGAGDVTVDVGRLTVAGDGSQGVNATAGGNAAVTVTGAVIGSADQPVGGSAAVGAGGRTQDPARAIIAVTGAGTATVRNNGTIATSGVLEAGISARGLAGASVSGPGTVSTSGRGATGVYAAAQANLAMIDVGSVTTTGDGAVAVHARSYGAAAAQVGTASTGGAGSIGVLVEGAGSAAATVGTVTTSGAAAHGIVSHSYGTAGVIAGQVSVTGPGALGINASSYGSGNVAIQANAVRVANGAGVQAFAADGAATVQVGTLTQASVLGQAGIGAYGTDGTAITFGTVTSSGDGQTAAVAAYAANAPISITGGTVVASGNGRAGVVALSNGGAVGVQVARIATSGTDAPALLVDAGTGAVTAQLGQATSTDPATPTVQLRGSTVALTTTGTLTAPGDAIKVVSTAGGTLVNTGSIGAGGAAVRASGGAVSLSNSGSISGALVLGDGADTVTNAGTLRLTGGTSFGAGDDRLINSGATVLAGDIDFGTGTNLVVNNGVLSFGAAAAVAQAPLTRSITRLQGFANSGTIDLRSGIAGDVLNLSGGFTGSGGSTLAIDVSATAADRLVVAGAATGSTRLVINRLDAPALGIGPLVVQAGSGTSAAAFSLASATTGNALLAQHLVFDAGTGSFRVAVTPSAAAFGLLNLPAGLQSVWLDSGERVAAHLQSDRDTPIRGKALWGTMSGQTATQHRQSSFTSFGTTQLADTSYRQDDFGAQLGLDLGSGRIGFGVTGGYDDSTMALAGGDQVRFTGWNAGVYASAAAGPAFANLLLTYNGTDVAARIAGARGRFHADGVGVHGEAGLHFGTAAFYAEPSVAVSWAHADLGTLALPVTVGFDDLQGGQAAAGLRIGMRHAIDGGALLHVYARGDYVATYGSRPDVTFATGASAAGFAALRLFDYGKALVGVSASSGGVTGFLEGDGRVGRGYRAGGLRAGLRISF